MKRSARASKNSSSLSSQLIVGLILVISIGVVWWKNIRPQQNGISNFEECAAAGYPIMESYPAQCRIPGGDVFTQQIASPEAAITL